MEYMERTIQPNEEGRDVLSFLRGEFGLSGTKIRSVKFEEQGILLDGKRVTVRTGVRAGQVLAVCMDDSSAREDHILANPMDLTVLYEDAYYLFVDKPAGMVSHPSKGHLTDSVANGVKYYLENRERSGESDEEACGGTVGVHLLGRLDKDTSGVLGFAKNGVAKQRLLMAKERGEYGKSYVLLTDAGGLSDSTGCIDVPLEEYIDEKKGGIRLMRQGKLPTAKEAVTRYELIRVSGDIRMYRANPETGRMHQIRCHFACMGAPLLGDALYGGNMSLGIQRAALHAESVWFIHPFTGKEIRITAGLPTDMKQFTEE